MDTSTKTIWHEDYNGSLLKDKSTMFDEHRTMDKYLQEIGYNTRVVAFFHDKAEYKEEIMHLHFYAKYEINRYNLRVGIVTDPDMIEQVKEADPLFFF